VLATNRAMLKVFHKSGLRLITDLEAQTYNLTAYFDDKADPDERRPRE